MTLHELNILSLESLKEELFKCCGSATWVNKMVSFFPMDDLVEMLEDAEEQWYGCSPKDWREAFSHQVKIGDTDSLSMKFGAGAQSTAGEQSAVNTSSREMIADLDAANEAYEIKFGYIFIVSAAGKTAEEMLSLLRQRLSNEPDVEINIAMDEQNKITLLRLQKLLT
ncbi:MAG: 2-oxo-4-hydroxy-4-carboxy-5-ureidoimidazoline decarboxylase [Ferruginibacter sp.]